MGRIWDGFCKMGVWNLGLGVFLGSGSGRMEVELGVLNLRVDGGCEVGGRFRLGGWIVDLGWRSFWLDYCVIVVGMEVVVGCMG